MKKRVLLVSATKEELDHFDFSSLSQYGYAVEHLVTGIGISATVFHLTVKLMEQPDRFDFALNAGIAGVFENDVPIGETFAIKSDCFADLGEHNAGGFSPVERLPIMKWADLPEDGKIRPIWNIDDAVSLKWVDGITSDTVAASEERVEMLRNCYNASVETMEGAAFYYVCGKFGLKSIQIRTVSNYLTQRSKAMWDIPLAKRNLANSLNSLFYALND